MAASATARAYVIADDLTGAADTALAFRQTGLSAVILPNAATAQNPPAPTVAADVLSLSTGTRNEEQETVVCEIVRQAAERHLLPGLASSAPPVYKKIDSTLRGWAGAEVRTLLDALPGYVAWVVPAYPRQGRRMRGGIYTVHGVPLHQSEFACDVRCLSEDSFVPALLERQMSERVAFVNGETISAASSPAFLAERAAEAMRANGSRTVLFDAEMNWEIAAIAEAGWQSGGQILWVGSAGLANQLKAELTKDDSIGDEESFFRLPPPDAPVVFVVGSQSAVAREQAAALTAHVGAQERVFALQGVGWKSGGAAENAQDVSVPLLLRLAPPVEPEDMSPARRLEVADEFGRAAADTVQRVGATRLLLTGGDTAAATLRHLGAVALEIIGEVEDGIPLSRLRGGAADGAFVVTKAGGFGKPHSLLLVFALLSGEMDVIT